MQYVAFTGERCCAVLCSPCGQHFSVLRWNIIVKQKFFNQTVLAVTGFTTMLLTSPSQKVRELVTFYLNGYIYIGDYIYIYLKFVFKQSA